MISLVNRAALVLAGGKARRFQIQNQEWRDKALAQLSGKPLLIHAIENINDVVDEVVICVNDKNRKATYEQVLSQHGKSNVRIVTDEKINNISGPNLAILTGLKAVKAEFCLTLPCDVPFFKKEVADYLFNQIESSDLVVPMWPNGRLETLILILRLPICLEIAQTLCHLKRPRSDDLMRGASEVLFASPLGEIKSFDPEYKSFININSQKDLLQLRARQTRGSVNKNLRLKLSRIVASDLEKVQKAADLFRTGKLEETSETFASCADFLEAKQIYFWAGLSRENQAETLLATQKSSNQAALYSKVKLAYLNASENYRLEAKIYQKNRCKLLAKLASADKKWCESLAAGRRPASQRYQPKAS